MLNRNKGTSLGGDKNHVRGEGEIVAKALTCLVLGLCSRALESDRCGRSYPIITRCVDSTLCSV